MSACTASFYAEGIKLRSGQASVTHDGRLLRVIAGDSTPGADEIHASQLADGTQLLVAGISVPLVWKAASQARGARHFDAKALKKRFGDEYPQIVEVAASNLPASGAKESYGYARAVADAYVGTLPAVGMGTALTRRPGTLSAFSFDALPKLVRESPGAVAMLAELVIQHVPSDDPRALIRLAHMAASAEHLHDSDIVLGRHVTHLMSDMVDAAVLELINTMPPGEERRKKLRQLAARCEQSFEVLAEQLQPSAFNSRRTRDDKVSQLASRHSIWRAGRDIKQFANGARTLEYTISRSAADRHISRRHGTPEEKAARTALAQEIHERISTPLRLGESLSSVSSRAVPYGMRVSLLSYGGSREPCWLSWCGVRSDGSVLMYESMDLVTEVPDFAGVSSQHDLPLGWCRQEYASVDDALRNRRPAVEYSAHMRKRQNQRLSGLLMLAEPVDDATAAGRT